MRRTELKRKTRLSPIGKKRRLASAPRGRSLILPPAPVPSVTTGIELEGGAFAIVHGEKPLDEKSETALRSVLSTAAMQLRAVPKTKAPFRDPAFLSLVRMKPCACCGAAAPSDPAHAGKRGLGQKTDDTRAFPACRWCHTFYDSNGYLPLDGPKTPRRARAYDTTVRRLTWWTEKRIAETQRELLVEYVRELVDGRAA